MEVQGKVKRRVARKGESGVREEGPRVMGTHGLEATAGFATNTEGSSPLSYFLPYKAVHQNTDCHGNSAQEHQYCHSVTREVKENTGTGIGSNGTPTLSGNGVQSNHRSSVSS